MSENAPKSCDCGGVTFTPAEIETAEIRRLADSIQRGTGPRVSAVMASLNEGDSLTATVASIKDDLPGVEIVVVDDASPKPEPIAAIRNPKRIGCSEARHIGCKLAGGDVVAVFDPHSALDPESAQWFWTKHKKGELWPVIRERLKRSPRAKLSTLAAIALKRQAIVYCLCNDITGQTCGLSRNGKPDEAWPDWSPRWQSRRPELPRTDLVETACMLGAVKVIPKVLLDLMGGWPKLWGLYWRDEEALSLLAAAHGIPILCHLGISMYHVFSGGKETVSKTYDLDTETSHNPATAAMYRLMFDDAHFEKYLPGLRRYCGQPAIDRVLNDQAWNAWRRSVQARFKLNSEELVAEVERRRARDKAERIPGSWEETA